MKYISSINSKINKVVKKHKLYSLLDVAYFILLLFGFHFVWKYWETELDFRFFSDSSILTPIFNYLTWLLFQTSNFFLEYLLKGSYIIEDKAWYFDNGGYIKIVDGCSGLKASLQFITIILLVRGPFKDKIWFIPAGILILFIANIVRIIGLDLIVYFKSSFYHFTHQYVFRPFFYGVIFVLWVVWIEKFKNRRQQ